MTSFFKNIELLRIDDVTFRRGSHLCDRYLNYSPPSAEEDRAKENRQSRP
ncbi:hypothetical protein TNIN_321, partial [Trichonephila inaurata madagascariensis]